MSWIIQTIAKKVNHPEFLKHNWVQEKSKVLPMSYREYICSKCGISMEIELLRGKHGIRVDFWEPTNNPKDSSVYCGEDFNNTSTCEAVAMNEALG